MARREDIFIENARIMWRNFEGREGRFNVAGQRNFVVFLTPEQGAQYEEAGMNVKYLEEREPGEGRQAYLKVKVKYNEGGPNPRIVLITSRGRNDLPEDLIHILDWMEIANVDLRINPYEGEVNGNHYVTAYLKSIYVTQMEDRLELKYADLEDITREEGANTIVVHENHRQPLELED